MKYLVYVRREYEAYVEVDADSIDGARNLVANKLYRIVEMTHPDDEVSVMDEIKPGDDTDPDAIKYEDLP